MTFEQLLGQFHFRSMAEGRRAVYQGTIKIVMPIESTDLTKTIEELGIKAGMTLMIGKTPYLITDDHLGNKQ